MAHQRQPRRSQRSGHQVRHGRHRGRASGGRRHHVAHLLHVEAHHRHRGTHVVGRRRLRTEGPGEQLHPRVRRHQGVARRLGDEPAIGTHHRGDAVVAFVLAHRRSHLRVHVRSPRRCDLSQERHGMGMAQRQEPRGGVSAPRVVAPGVPARHRVELFHVDRRARSSGRGGQWHASARLHATAHLRSARHDRHRMVRPRNQGRAPRGFVRQVARRRQGGAFGHRGPRCAHRASGRVRRWRPGVHDGGLREVRRVPSTWWRGPRNPPVVATHHRVHGQQSPSEQRRSHGFRSPSRVGNRL